VKLVRALTPAARRLGLLARWEREPRSRRAVWARSLFAIYDLDDMVHLDLAWWNFDALDRVAELLASRPNSRVFEYGSGASTVWLAKRAAQVTSIEHEAAWAESVRARLAEHPNAEVRLVGADAEFDPAYASEQRDATTQSFRAYASAIDPESEPFDLVVIDGRARVQCLQHAIGHLAPDGIILFDDSGRKRYRGAIAALGLAEHRYRGLSACVPYADSTSVLAPTS
jgi:SAM-dependent methyltransferase